MAGSNRDETRDYSPGHATSFDPNASLEDAFEDFMDLSLGVLSEATTTKYRYDFGLFKEWLVANGHPVVVGVLDDKHLLARYRVYHETRPNEKPGKSGRKTLSAHTVHSYMRVLRTLARHLVSEGRLPRDPFYGPRGALPHLGDRPDKSATDADVDALWRGTEGPAPLSLRDRMIVALTGITGARTGEVATLTVGDVHLKERWVHVPESKWGNERIVPMDDRAAGAISRYLRSSRPQLSNVPAEHVMPEDVLVISNRGAAMTPNGIYQAIAEAHERGGGEGPLGLHSLRHRLAGHALDAGVPAHIAMEVLGHDNIATTVGYASKPNLKTMTAAMARVNTPTFLPTARKGTRRGSVESPGTGAGSSLVLSALERPVHAAPPPPVSRRPSGAQTVLDGLERLASLRERALLTDEEFTAAKATLLG
jgi:integrase/recombinase XerD